MVSSKNQELENFRIPSLLIMRIVENFRIIFNQFLEYHLMLTRILLLAICFCLQMPCEAKGIVGRWHCTKEVTEQVEMGYEKLSCSYKFKKNGKLIIKIEGETAISHGLYSSHFNHQRRGYIYIKGKYTICDGKISSIVKNEGVETYAVESQDYHWKTETPPSESVSEISREESYGMARSRILRKRLLDYHFLWDWDEEPYTVTGKELKIGERLVCER